VDIRMNLPIEIPQEKIAALCHRWQITELALFGSVLRDDFRADSDVDVLISFDPQARHGLFEMVRMREELATILGILGGVSFTALMTLFIVVVVQMFLVGFLAARALPGERSEFIMELPPLRVPQIRNVIYKTLLRVRWYLGEAVPLFLIGTALLFVLSRLGLLGSITRAAQPLVVGLVTPWWPADRGSRRR